jgi:pimeloyl-ACP methyl ester carboxylesterase
MRLAGSVIVLISALVATPFASPQIPSAGAVGPPGQYADLPGVRLWYVDSGGTGDPVVLLHPITGTNEVWAPNVGALAAAGYRVIAYDRRGSGKSIVDASESQPGNSADDLHALAEHLRLPPFHLVGVAGGGFVALDCAAAYPRRLKTLIVGASTGSFAEPVMRDFTTRITMPGFNLLPAAYRELGPSYRGEHPEGVARWGAIEEHARQPGTRLQPLRTPNTFEKISRITARTLVLASEADLYAPPALMKIWARHLPHAEWTTVPEAGHAIAWERPEVFNAYVIGFLQGRRFGPIPSSSSR